MVTLISEFLKKKPSMQQSYNFVPHNLNLNIYFLIMQLLIKYRIKMVDTVGSTVALQQEDPGLNLGLRVFLYGVGIFSLCMHDFLPQSQTTTVRLISLTKLPLGVGVWTHDCCEGLATYQGLLSHNAHWKWAKLDNALNAFPQWGADSELNSYLSLVYTSPFLQRLIIIIIYYFPSPQGWTE